jgi:hypothetical protein
MVAVVSTGCSTGAMSGTMGIQSKREPLATEFE